jgi:modification methylase
VSSPPYFVGKEYEVGMSFEEHCEMVQDVLKECARVLKPGGIMALNVGDIHVFKSEKTKNPIAHCELMGHRYQSWLRRHDTHLTDLITWWKELIPWTKRPDIALTPDAVHTDYRILSNFEPVYIFRKKGNREVPSEEIVLRSRLTREQWIAWTPGVWAIKPVHNQIGHPTIYPDELCSRLIKMYSYEGDTVLDPFLGSGTTVKVAMELNRVGYGYEREMQYKQTIMDKLGVVSKISGADAIQQMVKNIADVKEPEVTWEGDEVESPFVDEGLLHASVGCAGNEVDGISLGE